MSRQRYRHFKTTCRLGINTNADIAKPEECADARNVYAPDGRIVQRPGYFGVMPLIAANTGSAGITNAIAVIESPVGTFDVATSGNLNISALAAGGSYYIGFDFSSGYTRHDIWSLEFQTPTASNTNSVYFCPRYSRADGTYHLFNALEVNSNGDAVAPHISYSTQFQKFIFTSPDDWGETTLTDTSSGTVYTRHFVKFTIKEGAASVLSTTTDIDVASILSSRFNLSYDGFLPKGAAAIQFANEKRYVFMTFNTVAASSSAVFINMMSSLRYENTTTVSSGTGGDESSEPASWAVVPQFNEAFVAQHVRVRRIAINPDSVADATVEDRDFAVGADAPYDKTLVAQDSGFPSAKYIMFFDGRLWAAGLQDDPHTVKWGAPTPFHKVWPSLSAEPLMEDDNSPITGLSSLNENAVVFKRDSVWIMVSNGTNSFGLREYTPVRVVSGVGCVSNSSIQKIRGRLLFLSEDGVYAFDGTPNIEKISDRIQQHTDKITQGLKHLASSAHWRAGSCYILSVSFDGSANNNTALVYDYKNNAWWVWDNIPANVWMQDEGSFDSQILYFAGLKGHLYRFNDGRNDNGAAVTSYVKTQRFGALDNIKRTVRQIEVTGDNLNSSGITLTSYVNDDIQNPQTGTLDFTDPYEVTYGNATDQTSKYVMDMRRARRLGFKRDFDWIQAEVKNTQKDVPFRMSMIDIAYNDKGRR